MTKNETADSKNQRKESILGRLLVVDDNENNRDILSRRLARRGHTVDVAENGEKALDILERESFDLILLDIMMPGIDGIEVLKRVRKKYSAGDLPVIMATAKDESEDVVKALEIGANDYVTKPLDFPVVLARVRTQLSLKRAQEDLAAANAQMKRDLEAAARVQRALLPKAPPVTQQSRFAWEYRPCAELAGDSLNVFKIDDAHIGVYVLDVSGHGVPSSLLSVMVSRSLSLHTDQSSLITEPCKEPPGYSIVSPSKVAKRLNMLFQMKTTSMYFFTMLYGVLETETGIFRYVSAGHPGPIRVRSGNETEIFDTPAVPIGMKKNVEYVDSILELQRGDRLYLYSDGLFEEMNDNDEQFGRDRMRTTIEEGYSYSLKESVDFLVKKVMSWKGDNQLRDDISLLAIEMI
jgi:sigma-B regulation protein RsbU (phosphoserine phosphatase)